MNGSFFMSPELMKVRQQEFMREAKAYRLAKLASQGKAPDVEKFERSRVNFFSWLREFTNRLASVRSQQTPVECT